MDDESQPLWPRPAAAPPTPPADVLLMASGADDVAGRKAAARSCSAAVCRVMKIVVREAVEHLRETPDVGFC